MHLCYMGTSRETLFTPRAVSPSIRLSDIRPTMPHRPETFGRYEVTRSSRHFQSYWHWRGLLWNWQPHDIFDIKDIVIFIGV